MHGETSSSSSGQAIPQPGLALHSPPSGGSSGASPSVGFGGDSPLGVGTSPGPSSSLGCASAQPEAGKDRCAQTRTPTPPTAHRSFADLIWGNKPYLQHIILLWERGNFSSRLVTAFTHHSTTLAQHETQIMHLSSEKRKRETDVWYHKH